MSAKSTLEFLSAKHLVVFLIGLLIAIVISAIVTLYAINTLFQIDIPIDATTVFSLTWLKIVIGGLIKGSK